MQDKGSRLTDDLSGQSSRASGVAVWLSPKSIMLELVGAKPSARDNRRQAGPVEDCRGVQWEGLQRAWVERSCAGLRFGVCVCCPLAISWLELLVAERVVFVLAGAGFRCEALVGCG